MQTHARIKHFTVRTWRGDMSLCDRHCTKAKPVLLESKQKY